MVTTKEKCACLQHLIQVGSQNRKKLCKFFTFIYWQKRSKNATFRKKCTTLLQKLQNSYLHWFQIHDKVRT